MNQTNTEYTNVINVCREIFSKKTKDYGTAWRILRLSSITDQVFIKAQRIRTLEQKKVSNLVRLYQQRYGVEPTYGISPNSSTTSKYGGLDPNGSDVNRY